MKNLKFFLLFLIIFLTGFAYSQNAQTQYDQEPWLQNLVPFQAEIVSTTKMPGAGAKTTNSKYYFMGGKIRVDDLTNNGIIIINYEKKITFVFNNQSNGWYKFTQPASNDKTVPTQKPAMKSQKMPDEVVDGKVCEVTRYVFEDPKFKGCSMVYVWKDKKIPLKISGVANGSTTEVLYKNIVFTKTPDSFFQPPAGAPVQDMSQFMNMPKQGK